MKKAAPGAGGVAMMPRWLRQAATAFAFACFGLGGLCMRLLYFPLLGLLLREPAARTRHARRTVQRSFAAFVRLLDLLDLVRVQVEGAEKLQRGGLLVLANHPTLVDVVILISLVRNADCVVKASLARNPFTRGPIAATGYIANDGGPELLDACMRSLNQGGNLVIFPEGTRTSFGEEPPMRLQRGAAQIAARLERNVTPVLIHGRPHGLGKGQHWWQVGAQAMRLRVTVGDDIAVAPFLAAASGEPSLAARHITAYLQALYATTQEANSQGA